MVCHLVNQCKSQNKCYHFLVEIVEKCSGFIPITEMRTPPPSKWPVLIIISERKFQTMDFSQIRICRPDPPSVLIRFLWMVRCVLNKFFFFQFLFFELLSFFGHFLWLRQPSFRWIFHNSKNRNRKKKIYSAHTAPSIKTGSKLRGGLQILSWEESTTPINILPVQWARDID